MCVWAKLKKLNTNLNHKNHSKINILEKWLGYALCCLILLFILETEGEKTDLDLRQSAQMEKKKSMAEQWRRREAIERANSVKGEKLAVGKCWVIRVRLVNRKRRIFTKLTTNYFELAKEVGNYSPNIYI